VSQDVKYVLVTGAAGGIGQAIVNEFINKGYTVIATDYVSQPAKLIAHHYVQADLAKTVIDEDYARNTFDQINKLLGKNGLNVLINNAAVQILGGLESLSRKDWQQTLNVNLVAPFIWTQALLPKLEKVQGSVVNISSIHAKLTKKNFVAYATSKAGLSGMTKALAIDVGSRIRVNAIEPAAIETEMLKAGFSDKDEKFKKLRICHPVGDIGQASDIANFIMKVATGGFQFMHGSVITFDGGISARLYDPEE